MKGIVFVIIHVAVTVAKLLGPGGTRAVIAENLFLKQQLLVLSRARRRSPNLSEFLDHVLFWNSRDLKRKFTDFQIYYNAERVCRELLIVA